MKVYTGPMRPLLFLLAAIAYAAPCTTAASSCTEWIGVAGAPERLLVYRSFPLDANNAGIKRALVLIHGGGRDAAGDFRSALAAAFLAGALDDTVLVAPRFASNRGSTPCQDNLASAEANWGCADGQPDSWRNGAAAMGSGLLTSFDFADEILRRLARKELFPNLRAIVMAGHSGGAQFALRYAMANQMHDKLSVPITYVVSNADALVYLDPLRPTAAAYPVSAAPPGFVPSVPDESFAPLRDAANCTTYENWPYGLVDRAGYTARFTGGQLRKQLAARPITYLLGGLDILPAGGFDSSCPAMAQGPTRRARGHAFAKYMNEKYGARHEVVVARSCGHDSRCMFTAEIALPLLFPRQ